MSAKLNKRGVLQLLKTSENAVIDFVEHAVEIAKSPPPKGSPFDTGNNRDSIASAGSALGPIAVVSNGEGIYSSSSIPGIARRGKFIIYSQSGYGGWLEVGSNGRKAYRYIRNGVQSAIAKFKRMGNWEQRYGVKL